MNAKPAWDQLLQDIGIWMELQFCLNSKRDKEVWQFIIGAAAHLELLAIAVLWINDGKQVPFDNYREWLTLNQAAGRIENVKLLTPQIVQILKDVARLRNAVAHRGAAFGVTGKGEYKGHNVFSDLDALSQLVDDHTMAASAIDAWHRAHN